MYIPKAILISGITIIAQICAAEETRMHRLANSYLIENLKHVGNWEIKVSESAIEYKCLKCGRKTEAILEVINPYTRQNHGTLEQRYLYDRKVRCAELVTLNIGRCVQTRAIEMRGGALSGFQSVQEIDDSKEIEIVFFYHETKLGPELIKTTISIKYGANIQESSLEMFRWHMARLTLFW